MNGLGWNRNTSYFSFFQLGWNLDGDWPIRRQNPYQHQFVNVNNNNYTCCTKMTGKEEISKCRKKTVAWTNEMTEDLIDFMEIHSIVPFEGIYEPMLTSFWSLISFAVHNNANTKGSTFLSSQKCHFVCCISRQNLCLFIKISCIVYTQTWIQVFLIQVFLNGDLDAQLVSCIPGFSDC